MLITQKSLAFVLVAGSVSMCTSQNAIACDIQRDVPAHNMQLESVPESQVTVLSYDRQDSALYLLASRNPYPISELGYGTYTTNGMREPHLVKMCVYGDIENMNEAQFDRWVSGLNLKVDVASVDKVLIMKQYALGGVDVPTGEIAIQVDLPYKVDTVFAKSKTAE